MKVLLLAENLQKKLSFSNKAISSRNQLPILSHVLLETKGDTLVLSTTDLEIGIEIAIPCEVQEQGATTVPARLFLELVNSLPQEKISLETKEGVLEVRSKKTKSVLQTSPRDEFPLLYEEKGEKVAVFTKGNLKSVFSKILFAASIENSRPALSGVYFKRQKEFFTVVATDGYRLSLDEVMSQTEEQSFENLLLPARILREAIAIFENEDTILYLSQKNNQVIFEQDGTLLIGRTIEAEFPNYEKVIPTDSASVEQVDRESLLRAVKACAIFAREGANIITLSLRKNALIVSSKSPSLGENTVEVDATLTGEENDIAFNARYLLEALTVLPENDLSFSMTGPLNPGVFRIGGNSHFLHLIMPIRT
ncbi:MAG TPA: DNA polymerase III subunit beta [Patescibacteria group bacterium]|nr:DNA polymerase III subunit beta [Patescibacteria group bacterium]